MFKTGKIISHNPILIDYSTEDFERLEPKIDNKKGFDDYQIPQAVYFSPFEKLNDFLGTSNPEFESVYIWNTYDKAKEVIQNPSMRIDDNDLVLIEEFF